MCSCKDRSLPQHVERGPGAENWRGPLEMVSLLGSAQPLNEQENLVQNKQKKIIKTRKEINEIVNKTQ